MRFIHILLTLAFAVVVSAAHFKRDPPQLGLDIASITTSAQSVYDAVDELSTPDVRAELAIQERFVVLNNTVTAVTIDIRVIGPLTETESQTILKAAQSLQLLVGRTLALLVLKKPIILVIAVIENDLVTFQIAVRNLFAALVVKFSADLQPQLVAIRDAIDFSLNQSIAAYASA
ncbi:hypothetical protein AX14_014387 [Amanita brunnescens Koide BX004]|nr:hypothetical protein AX14_014387 [Amanita brunnescens Koide BX004]